MSPDAVRDSLNRVAASPGFAASPRLRKFLCFVVERTLDGRTEDLKETVVGVEYSAADASYDPGIDPVVASRPDGSASGWSNIIRRKASSMTFVSSCPRAVTSRGLSKTIVSPP